MTRDQFDTPAREVQRDRYGRPLVFPTTGGAPVAYTRMTTHVAATEDAQGLVTWKTRMVALGLAAREDLHLAVAAHRDDPKKVDRLCEQALEAASANAGATKGTALHALTEQWDAGTLNLADVPAAYRPDVEAYARALEGFEVVEAEKFGVLDDLRVAGTWDRVLRDKRTGRQYIADLKTGRVDYSAGKIAAQLAGYSRATPYDPDVNWSRARGTPNPDRGIDQRIGIVIHLPAGGGECALHDADLTAGWDAVLLAARVREWRTASRRLLTPRDTTPDPGDLHGLIAAATTVDRLTELWRTHQHEWTPDHTAAAAARKTQLAQAS